MSFYDVVYEQVKKIPHGKVATYGQIACLCGSPRASRAVGYVLHFNPDPEHIPCFRVVNRFGRCAPAFAFGGPDSFAGVAIYIVMGLIGIPVFSAGGGFAYVLQPTFGYILGFLIAAPVGGFVARALKNNARLNVFRLLLGAFCSLAIVYTVGVFYMYLRFVSSFSIYRTFARRG